MARPGADMVVQNDVYTVTVSASTNRISSVVYRPTNQSVPLDQNIVWYPPAPYQFTDPRSYSQMI